jgi:hypothetical protein
MISGDSRFAPESLAGGPDPGIRFAIHLRHYQTSLRTSLEDKFPATVWLLGARLFRAAASTYVRECPPRTPCIAEFGRDFPEFIARYERAAGLGYVESFARLEWALGRASTSLNEAPLSWHELVAATPARLLDATFGLQPGVGYLRAAYAVDELLMLYLRNHEPESFELPVHDTAMEVSGSRGSFRIDRLPFAAFEFRATLHEGKPVGDAASRALELDERFDPGEALRGLVAAGLIVSLDLP